MNSLDAVFTKLKYQPTRLVECSVLRRVVISVRHTIHLVIKYAL